MSPILYDASLLTGMFGTWSQVNPMSSLINGVRGPLLWQDASTALPWPGLLAAAVALLLAWAMSRRFRPYLREFL